MHKAIALLELIFSVFILFAITLFTSTFYSNIYTHNKTQQQNAKQHLDLLSTQLFLFKLFKQSHIQTVSAQEILFLQTAYEAFLSNLYSGYINLDNSSKTKLHSPFSNTQALQGLSILFDNTFNYALQSTFENEYFYFSNPNSVKHVYETYELIQTASRISLKDNKLYYNDALLLQEVSKFQAHVQDKSLKIDICHYKQCDTWNFLL